MNLKELLAEKDITNIHCLIPITHFMAEDYAEHLFGEKYKDEMVACKIDETRHKIADNYKISFRPVSDKLSVQHYYQTDATSLIKEGSIILYEKIKL